MLYQIGIDNTKRWLKKRDCFLRQSLNFIKYYKNTYSNITINKMKNKSLYTALVYWFSALLLVLFLSGCRTKKSSIDSYTKQTENVSIIDKSKTDKKETVQENIISSTTSNSSDKSFFESWMSFESNKITITDVHGTKTEITNPKINKKQSQKNDISKVEQMNSKINKASKTEENNQSDVNIDAEKQIESEFHSKDNRETKIIWLWIIGGGVIGGLGYLVLKRFKLV